MFCYQCEQTARGEGCTVSGVCGKQPGVAALQDLLIYALKGLSLYAVEGRKKDVRDPEVNTFTCEAVFSTLTNVNFDPNRFVHFIHRCVELRDSMKSKVEAAGGTVGFPDSIQAGPATFRPEPDLAGLVKQGEAAGIKSNPTAGGAGNTGSSGSSGNLGNPRSHGSHGDAGGSGPGVSPDVLSLQQTLTIGIKGVAAYASHAATLGEEDEAVYAFIHEGLAATLNRNLSAEELVRLVLQCGKVNLRAMELLDAANTGTYGHPVPTKVPLGAKKGKAILVSGHDLKDLEEVLKQSEGKGISVYTHGEMLPCHGYPGLKKYPHFYGHFGTAWQNQVREFAQFPGAILMTTNCIQKPGDSYKDNIFTCDVVGWPGVTHIENRDFSPLIEKALSMPGFSGDIAAQSVMVGFARNAVLSVADKVVDAVKTKALRHIFLVAGCDGARPGRNYYTELVEKIPSDCLVLTLACGKFRFFDKNLGDIGGIPRLLDIGQCNDAYSAIQIAAALAKVFDCGLNDLPLSLILSWYEQKAVAILLTLFSLGIKDIRLGPSLPAFVSPAVLDVLVKTFNIKPISTPDEDLKAILG
ncbi:MAG: hydroxylamine reductase [bacterium]